MIEVIALLLLPILVARADDVLATHNGYTAEAQSDFEARLTKLAVDPEAKKYWSKYFKDYGKMLTRDIPRKKHKSIRKSAEVDQYAKDYWTNYLFHFACSYS